MVRPLLSREGSLSSDKANTSFTSESGEFTVTLNLSASQHTTADETVEV
jgi:hypothetical protein